MDEDFNVVKYKLIIYDIVVPTGENLCVKNIFRKLKIEHHFKIY